MFEKLFYDDTKESFETILIKIIQNSRKQIRKSNRSQQRQSILV